MASFNILTCIVFLIICLINSFYAFELSKMNGVLDTFTEVTSTENYTQHLENGNLSNYNDTESSDNSQENCPFLEHWNNCFAHCQHNCSNWGLPIECPDICTPGCVCDDGYVRGPNNECIRPMECRNLNEIFELDGFKKEDVMMHAPEMQTCPSKEHWGWCNAKCQKTCANKGEPRGCSTVCKPGCICNAGFVRGPDGKCVLPSQCPKQEEDISEEEDFCPPNEEFSRCLAHCQRNCSNWSDPSAHCQKICVPGCICKPGMVRSPHGDCIQPRKCPKKDKLGELISGYDCPVEEHYDNCNAHCQKNCSNWNETLSCPQLCVPGCICDEGYVRSTSGRCISTLKCSESNIPANSEVLGQNYDIPHCPDVHSCTEWCRRHGYHYGYCTSIFHIQCMCEPWTNPRLSTIFQKDLS